MRFDYVLDGAGWATATITVGGSPVAMRVSYLHDSLGQLADAILELESGREEAVAVFMAEPGEHHLLLRRKGDDVAIKIKRFADWASWGIGHTDRYEVVAAGTSRFAEVRKEVVACLQRVLAEHGVEGYRAKWMEHEFPMAAYGKLTTAEF